MNTLLRKTLEIEKSVNEFLLYQYAELPISLNAKVRIENINKLLEIPTLEEQQKMFEADCIRARNIVNSGAFVKDANGDYVPSLTKDYFYFWRITRGYK